MAKKTVTSNPFLKGIIGINICLCAICFIGLFVVAYWPPADHTMGEKLHWICEHTFLLGSGAFFGLLGGRVAAPDH